MGESVMVMDREMRLTVGVVASVLLWVAATALIAFGAFAGSFEPGRFGLLVAAMAVTSTVRCSMACQGNRTRAMVRALVRDLEVERGLHRVQ